jgi:hypothetical protein
VGSRSSSKLVQIWRGTTPAGYTLVIELDERNRWVATVAAASRSRNYSLEAALLEAAGTAISRQWAARLAATITARSTTASRPQERQDRPAVTAPISPRASRLARDGTTSSSKTRTRGI